MTRRSVPRPVFFDLTRIQLPVGELTSITHRITGIVHAISIPIGLYAVYLSLVSERLEHLNDVYRLFRCRSIMNCTEVCPKALAPSRAIESIKLAILKEAL